jgi:hypothetical protein
VVIVLRLSSRCASTPPFSISWATHAPGQRLVDPLGAGVVGEIERLAGSSNALRQPDPIRLIRYGVGTPVAQNSSNVFSFTCS